MKPGEGHAECTTVDDVVNHIVHIGENFGYDIVGIGGDFNGAGSFAKDADTIAKYPNIMAKVRDPNLGHFV